MRRSDERATQPVERYFQFSLLGLLASGYFAMAGSGSLDLPTVAITGIGLLVRLLLITGTVRLELSGRWIAAATLAYFGFYPLDVLYLSGEFIPATVHLICFLAVLRILTAKSDRDYFFVKVIAFLELLAATLLSNSVNFFLFLTLFVLFGVATFCCSEMRRSGRLPNQEVLLPGRVGRAMFGRRLALLTAGMTVGIVILTAGLFFLLPRTARAAFRSLVNERYHLPGFSGEVTLGQIGELKQQSTPVMHVRIQDPYQQLGLKWRGAALTRFDGRRWSNPSGGFERIRIVMNGPTALATDSQRRRPGKRIAYEVRVGPVDSDVIFFAGTPEFLQAEPLRVVYRSAGDTYRTGLGSVEGRTYSASGHVPGPAQPLFEIGSANRNELAGNLLLPAGTDSRILALAERVGRGSTALQQAQSIERHLQTEYPYTTELPPVKSEDPLATFLFERKKGHCEYFASAMAVMLRAIRIPARVVTGFQSGTYNPMTGWHVIRASDAHSWVEAYLPGEGWVTFDPTPPDARGAQGTTAILAKLLLYADAAETLWRDWVINYTIDRQIDFVARVEPRGRLFSAGARLSEDIQAWLGKAKESAGLIFGVILLCAVIAAAVSLAGPALWERLQAFRHGIRVARGQAVASDAAVLYTRMLRVLRKRGIEKPGWLTPAEFARAVPASSRDSQLVQQITSAYHDLRYAGRADAGTRMIELLQELETGT